MSTFIDHTPCVQIIINNPFSRKSYPHDGSITAIIDTGYQGFLSIPNLVFRELGLNKLSSEKRKIALANGSLSDTTGCYATLRMPHLPMEIDGFVETFSGLDEVVLGVEALMKAKVLMDYCSKRVRIERCFPK